MVIIGDGHHNSLLPPSLSLSLYLVLFGEIVFDLSLYTSYTDGWMDTQVESIGSLLCL